MDEFELIETYFAPLAMSAGAENLKDDVASLEPPAHRKLIITTDMIVERTHFLPSDPLDSVGKKLIRVNVSDILAKGGVPWSAVLSIAWPKHNTVQQMEQLVSGIADDLRTWNIALMGGDTTRIDGPLCLNLTLLGHCPKNGPVRRSGAGAGEDVWVTGTIGDGKLGLIASIEGFNSLTDAQLEAVIDRYRCPAISAPQASDIVSLYATSALDVSDGLIADSMHLAKASALCFHLSESSIPLSDEAHLLLKCGEVDLETLLTGGDDYQILFTAEADSRESLIEHAEDIGVKLTHIGRTSDGQGVIFEDGLFDLKSMIAHGWSHF